LYRSSKKFPGRQKIIVSTKMGFSKLTHREFLDARNEGKIDEKGSYCSIRTNRGPLSKILKK